MSVYASKRSESKVEFLRVAQQLAVYTLKQTKKFPKSYRFNLTNDIVRLAMEIHENVLRANSIYIHKGMSNDEFRLREIYFAKAKSSIFAMSSLLTITFSLVLEGNNFLGDKKAASNIFKEWARLLNYESALLKGVVDSDRKRYKSYQRNGKVTDEICGKTFEDVFTYENMVDASKSCCTGVRWKTSTINFETMLLTQADNLQERLLNDEYKFQGFKHFKTIEHGKERDINALDIHDRTIQKCYCDFLMTEAYSRTFIYDNSASLPGKGMDMTLERLKMHLIRHYRKYGIEGGIYQFDFHGYFASIPHDKAKERLCKHIHDKKLQEIGCQLIDDFITLGGVEQDADNPHGVGLGSQVSQNIALDFASPIDHYIKDVLRKEGYARYMDDGYVISNSLKELYEIRDFITELARSFGLEINEKKNVITPFANHSFRFLKMRIRLEPSGKVVMKLSRNSIKAIRRKLQIFRLWVDEGKFSAEDAFTSYQSWRSHAQRCDSYKTLHAMDIFFVKLFQKELAERKDKFKCTLDAKWDYEVGWIYFTSIKEYRAVLDELDRTRNERYWNGFVPLCDRWDWRMKQRSKNAEAFSALRELRENFYFTTE